MSDVTVQLLPDPRRAWGSVLVAGGSALWMLPLAAGLFYVAALGIVDPRQLRTGTGFVRWLAVLIPTLFGVFLAVLGSLCVRALLRALRLRRHTFLLGLAAAGLVIPGVGTLPWSSIEAVTLRWQPIPSTGRPGSTGARLGRWLADAFLRAAHQDRTIRHLEIELRDQAPITTANASQADDADFGRFVEQLDQELRSRGVAMRVERG